MSDDFIHRFVPGADPDAATIVALHGTGGDENDLVPLARAIGGGSAILSPRGRALENGMPRFFRRLAHGGFDLDDLRAQTAALVRFIAEAGARYGFDRSRVAAVGYSNGANIAASILLTYPEVFASAILFRPMIPFEPERVPDLADTPVLLVAGRHDPIVPSPLTERLAALLEEAGARVTTLWQSTGHAISATEIAPVAAWWADADRA